MTTLDPPTEAPSEDVETPARVLTFLIADIRGYTQFTAAEGDEAAAELTTAFARVVREAAAGHQGTLLELRGDEALAYFPSARQALRAAIDLQRRVGETPLAAGATSSVGIGLDAGEAVPVEGGFRGTALNLAARLCAAADAGEILASATVTALAGRTEGIRFADRGEQSLKGFPAPVRAYRITEAGAQTETQPAPEDDRGRSLPVGGFLGSLPAGKLAGRTAELEVLRQIARTVQEGAGSMAVLAGEPGAGKTRLAQELTIDLMDAGFLVAAGSCYDTRESTAFYPFSAILATVYELAGREIQEQARRRLPSLARIIPIMPRNETPASEGDDRERLFWAAAALVEAVAATRPIAIMIDDLHWADGSSLDLLTYLARATRTLPILILATYRDNEIGRRHPLEGTLRELGRQQLLTRIPVRRLEVTGTRELVSTLLETGEVAPDLARIIHNRTEGNPFFVQQVVRVLDGSGRLANSGGHMSEAELEALDVPESIRSVTAQRLSRLDEAAQTVLARAAVFGLTFRFDDLLRLTALSGDSPDEDELEERLRRAAECGVVTTIDGDIWAFDHSLTREVIYNEVPSRRRRRLHLAAAQALEDSSTETGGRPADVAHHYLEGDDAARALPFVMLAGRQAAEIAAHAEAEVEFTTAIELAAEVNDIPRLIEAHTRLGETSMRTGRYREAVEHLLAAAESSRQAGETVEEDRLIVRASLGLANGLRAEAALERLAEVIPRLQARGEEATLAQAYAVQARVFMGLGRYEDQLDAATESERLARNAGDLATVASALIDRGTALSQLGRTDTVLELLEEAIDLAGRQDDDLLLWRALNNAAVLCWEDLGPRSEAFHRRALETVEKSGAPCEIAHTRAALGLYSWLRGEWTEAMHWFESAAAVADLLGVSTASWTLPLPGWLLALKGRVEEATQRLDACIARAVADGDRPLLVNTTLRLAQQDLLQGRPERALGRMEEVVTPGEELGTWRRGFLLVGLEAAMDSRQEAAAARFAEELEAERFVEPWLLIDWQRLKACRLVAQGRSAEGRQLFEQTLELARRVNKLGEADVLRAWGLTDLAAEDLEAARERLCAAREVYRDLHARPMAEAVETELLALERKLRE